MDTRRIYVLARQAERDLMAALLPKIILWHAREQAGIREGDVYHKALPFDRTTEGAE